MSMLALCATIFLTAAFSILVLAFKTDASTSYQDVTDNGRVRSVSLLRPDSRNGGLRIAQYPEHVSHSRVKLILGGAGGSLLLALGMGLLLVFVTRRPKALLVSKPLPHDYLVHIVAEELVQTDMSFLRQLLRWQRISAFLLLAGNFTVSLVIFVVCAADHFQSAKLHPGYRTAATECPAYGPHNIFDGGDFDLGSWTCQFSNSGPFQDEQSALSRQCRGETAALWIGLLVALSNLVITALIWLDWKGQRIICRDLKSTKEAYESYYL